MVVALTGVMAGCSAVDQKTQSKPIRIGAILSMSGTYAALGEAERNALRLEVDRLNAEGGIYGRPIELIVEDDGTDESKAVSAAQKLIEQDDVVALIGASGTGQSMAVRSLVEQANMAQISLAGGSVITSKFSSNVFQMPWPNELLIRELFSQLDRSNITKIAVLSDNGGYGKDGRDIILSVAAEKGIEISADVVFKPGDTDLSGQINAIQRSDAQAVILWNAGKEAPIALKTARDSGLNLPWFGGSGQARAEFIEGAGNVAEGFTIVTGKSFNPKAWDASSLSRKKVEAFSAAFAKEYNKDPDIFAGHAYDAITILHDSLLRTDQIDRQSLLRAIEETNRVAGYGGEFSFSQTDHNGLTVNDITFLHVKDGAWNIGVGDSIKSDGQKSLSGGQLFGQTILTGISSGAIYALIGLGFVAVFLASGAINFAQGEFVMLPGLTAAFLGSLIIPSGLAWPLGVALGPIIGALFWFLLVRPTGQGASVRSILITIGGSVALRQLALHSFGPNELSMANPLGDWVLSLAGLRITSSHVLALSLTAVMFGSFLWLYRWTKFGKAMQANQQSEIGAMLCGIQPRRVALGSYMIAGLAGALAGMLLIPVAQMAFDSGVLLGIKGFTVAIVGGLANPIGTLAAGVGIGVIESLVAGYVNPLYKDALVLVLLIAMLIIKPTGIFGKKEEDKQ